MKIYSVLGFFDKNFAYLCVLVFENSNHKIMSVTRLERKLKRRRRASVARDKMLKLNNFVPPMLNVDVEAIKAEFEKNKKA